MEKVGKYLKKGDLITHSRCLGHFEEHYFTEFDGIWMCGNPTKETKKHSGGFANDISTKNITHINREPVEFIELSIELPTNCNACMKKSYCKNPKRFGNAYGGLECTQIRDDIL